MADENTKQNITNQRNQISKSANIGAGVKFGSFCVIMENVIIGPASRLGNGVIIYPGVTIGNNAWIEDYVVIGRQPKGTKYTALKINPAPPATIGNNVVLNTQCIIYAGSKIGNDVFIADRCLIRERAIIENLVRMGKGVIIEHNAHVEKGALIQSYTIIAEYMQVGKGAFIGTFLCSNADKYMKMHAGRFHPPTIKKGARVGGNVTLLPGVIIGEHAVVGAGAVVTKDVPPKTIVIGNPARYLKDVDF